MKFFKKTSGQQGTDGHRHVRYAPGTKIPYREDLVEELVSEHRTLILVFRQVTQAHVGADHIKVYQLLNELKSLLHVHALKENTYIYLYLKHVTQVDGYGYRLVRDLHREMEKIGRNVSRFVQRWTADGNVFYDDRFLKELNAIEEALTKRIEKEEKGLFAFYAKLATHI